MKLLYVTAALPYGPGEAFVIPELSELAHQGHELCIVPTRARGPIVHEDARALEGRTEEPALLSLPIVRGAAIAAVRSPVRTARALLTIFHSRSPLIFAKNVAVLPKALWLARRLRQLEIEHLHAHWGGTSSTLAMLAAEASGTSWSVTLHRWDIAEDNLLATKISRACFVRTISRSGLEEARRHSHDRRDRLIVLPMGVAAVSPREIAPQGRAVGRLLMAANFVAVKGHRWLLDSAAVLQQRGVEFRLDLAGEGPLVAETVEHARRLGLEESVRFLGQLPHPELLQRLADREWDVVLLSSVETVDGEREGIPVILMEAMAAGVPVVAPHIGGISELLNGGAGLLVGQADAQELADAVQLLLSDDDIRVRVAEAGRRRVAESFSIESVVSALAEQFRRCAAPPSSAVLPLLDGPP
jgi:glycosyltransferase involved in cell wall biosynthesis